MSDDFFDTMSMKSEIFLHSLPCSPYADLSWLTSGFSVPFGKPRPFTDFIRYAICSWAPMTLTQNDLELLLPAASLAEQLTSWLPTRNTLPEAGEHASEVTPTLSVASTA